MGDSKTQANQRFIQTLQLLLERTKANGVLWSSERSLGYVADVAAQRIAINFIRPPSDPDCYEARLLRGGSAALSFAASEGDEGWELLAELYSEAERTAIGWDKALTEVEQALRSGTVWAGKPKSQEITDDDIPF